MSAVNGKAKRFAIRKIQKHVLLEYICTVDAEDAHLLRNYVWTVKDGVDKKGVTRRYIARTVDGVDVFLHHQIISSISGEKVYHINGDTLDCRKENLMRTSERVRELE